MVGRRARAIYLRDRLIVLTPVFLIAGPGLIGVHDLGGGVAVGILSGAVGFSAAAILGIAWWLPPRAVTAPNGVRPLLARAYPAAA